MEDKRFDSWEEIDCNDCARWWDSSCDGIEKGVRKPCNSFSAKRDVIIPEQIKSLQKSLKTLNLSMIFLGVAMLIHIIGGMFE